MRTSQEPLPLRPDTPGRERVNRNPIIIMAPITKFTKTEFFTEKSAICMGNQSTILTI